ncbi:MAG: hypothetical protein WB992_22800 [Bryobacteraceae bacterium]
MILPLLVLFATVAKSPDLLDEGYRDMYNLAFNDAHQRFQQYERIHPDDPMGPASDAAAYLFTEFDRLNVLRSEFLTEDKTFLNSKKLKPDPAIKRAFQADLQHAQQLSESILRQAPDDEDALLATVLRLALQSDYSALIDKQYVQALNGTKETRAYAERLLAKHPGCFDADLAVGFENYILSLKPAPVRWILKLTGSETDQQVGITKLRLVAEKGHYLKPYAKVLLAIAALRNNDKAEAKRLMAELAHQFPNNGLFRDELQKLS